MAVIRSATNTLQIMLDLNKKFFAPNPAQVSDNDRLLREFTLLDCKAAHLGTTIRKLPDITRDQERAETAINKFRAAKTPEATTAFNVFVDEIQEPATRASQYVEHFAQLQKSFRTYVSQLHDLMKVLLPQSLADTRRGNFLIDLKAQGKSFPELVTITESLARDGGRLHSTFDSIAIKATKTLSSVAPEIAMQDKRADKRSGPADSPFNPE